MLRGSASVLCCSFALFLLLRAEVLTWSSLLCFEASVSRLVIIAVLITVGVWSPDTGSAAMASRSVCVCACMRVRVCVSVCVCVQNVDLYLHCYQALQSLAGWMVIRLCGHHEFLMAVRAGAGSSPAGTYFLFRVSVNYLMIQSLLFLCLCSFEYATTRHTQAVQ